ncbi:uncharacterized protein LOC128217627 [Mya arenaria]|uniref:uncharacterized protein LOC128217627 n=1 Tax=Mya arenaria TaxID=6604 RepID=UPI0022E5BB85|nr:uncharacterized protein LOC128217627 [Mya arenaria]
MEGAKSAVVAPSFGDNQSSQFEGMDADFSDEQFEDFTMDSEYSKNEAFKNKKSVGAASSVESYQSYTDTGQKSARQKMETPSWDQIKFGAIGMNVAENKTASVKPDYEQGAEAIAGETPDENFEDFGAEGFDYEGYDDGYDDNMINNDYISPEKANIGSAQPVPQQQIYSQNSRQALDFEMNVNRKENGNTVVKPYEHDIADDREAISNELTDIGDEFGEVLNEVDEQIRDTDDQIKESVDEFADDEEGEENDNDEDYEEEDEDDEDLDSDAEYTEDDGEDEDINEALNSLGNLAADMDMEVEGMAGETGEGEAGPSEPLQDPSGDGEAPKEKKRRKRKKKGDHAEGDGEGGKQKKKRKRKGEKGEGGEKKKGDNHARKNIRKILTESNLDKETLDAQNAELDRQRRLQELKRQQLAALLQTEREPKKEKDSQLKSLLQSAEEEAEKTADHVMSKVEIKEEPIDDFIKPRKEGVIDISSGEDDDDVVMVRDEDEDEGEDASDEDFAEAEDVNNSGSHINDQYNVPDEHGRVLVNVGHPTSDPDIYLSPLVAKCIKPHQIGGVRFLYDNLVECINRFKTSSGFGCILAHSMGLGKTIQMVGFIDIFLRHTGAKSVMVIVPINTLANWLAEFNMWVPDKETCEKYNLPESETDPRPYRTYLLNDIYKNTPARAKVVSEWYKTGGVLLLGYEMYRLLSSKKVHLQKSKGKKKVGSDVIDVEAEDRDKNLLMNIHEALVNPGPDLVVCDEGHRIKNSHAGISVSLKQIKTKRRIVLTGYPLQNNLIEYWCMVDFVRPNFLGNKTEFCNMFERPIMNGQCVDSTPQDMRLMRYRAHVLHSLLEGFVQRRGHTVLQAALPPKEEYVFKIRMSPIQQKLYDKFMESVTDSESNGWVNNNPLKAFSVCCKIWNHPDILYNCMKKSLDDNDLDIETGEPKKKGGRAGGKGKKETPPATPNPLTPMVASPASDTTGSFGSQGTPGAVAGPSTPVAPLGPTVPAPGVPTVANMVGPMPLPNFGRSSEPTITYDWANEIFKDYVPGMLENGGKMIILFNLISESLQMGDKILVFSQSLFTLNLIEEFLSKYKVPRPELDELWCRNKNYFRLDGSTSSTEREKLINSFNSETNKWLFLLSTRAGSLGINLVAANRVVVVDASWNPCHDCQAICRVYRFGQLKPSYIYRLVTENTMEKKIYDRQVNKQGMADRVVDELNPQNQFKKEHVDKLMVHENKEFDQVDFSDLSEYASDTCLCNMLHNQGHWLTSKPFTHESLLIDRKELKLTMKEKRLAKQSYVMEKRLNVSYSRPSYSAYYPRAGAGAYQGTIRGRGGMVQRPIASVKPMVSTPVPMRPKIVAAPTVLKPGVSVHQVLTTTEIVLPGTNTTTEAGTSEPKKIPAGQQVLVIRTPKGVYIRTPDGKIFAVRSKPQPNSNSPLDTLANTGSNLSTGGVTIVRPTMTTTVSAQSSGKTTTGVTVIRPNIRPSLGTTTKPLTIIRQGPGQVRTIIPVTINRTGSGTSTVTVKPSPTSATQIATIAAQSQKVSSALQSAAKIRIVAPNTNTSSATGGMAKVSSLTTLQNLASGDKKIISKSPAFSGGTTVIKNVQPKVQNAIQNVNVNAKTIAAPYESANVIANKQAASHDKPEPMEVKPATAELKPKVNEVKPESELKQLVQKSEYADSKPKMETQQSTDAAWNLPPIDMKALKLPQQFNKTPTAAVKAKAEKGQRKSSAKSKAKDMNKGSKGGKPPSGTEMPGMKRVGTPKFSLSNSPSDSSMSGTQSPDVQNEHFGQMVPPQSNLAHQGILPMRPSEIDLHQMKLSGSSASLASMGDGSNFGGDGQCGQNLWSHGMQNNQSMSQFSGGNQFQSNTVQPMNTESMNQSNLPSNNSNSNAGFFNPGLPDNSHTVSSQNKNQMLPQGQGSVNQPMMQNQGQGFSNNQNIYGGFGGPAYIDNQRMNMNNSNLPGLGHQSMNIGNSSMSSGARISNTISGISNASMNSGIGNSGMSSGTAMSQADQNSATPHSQNMGDFTMSGIHNNSSFLSELTETDENFLSALDENSQGSSGESSDQGNPSVNIDADSSSTPIMANNITGGQLQQQQGQMNFDMFSQQNQGFYPNFGNNQFNRNSNFGNQPNMNMSQQGNFPGGSMYPMGGMMQPGMFPYPTFAPYPYPPMMAPMPYYPMPFQPQYGNQAGMGHPTGNIPQGTQMGQNAGSSTVGMPVGNQTDSNYQPGMGN